MFTFKLVRTEQNPFFLPYILYFHLCLHVSTCLTYSPSKIERNE